MFQSHLFFCLFLIPCFLHPILQALQERVESLQRQQRTAEKKLMSRELETQEQVRFFFNYRELPKLRTPEHTPTTHTKPDEVLLKVIAVNPRTFLTLL